MTHAPIRLPITANKKQFAKDIEIVDSRGFIVLRINQHVESFRDKKDQEIAAFIVKACNAHEALLRVCRLIYEIENERDDFAPDWMTDLREAIALAEGRHE